MEPPSAIRIYLAPNDYKYTEITDDMVTPMHVEGLERGELCVKMFIKAQYWDSFENTQEMSFKFKTMKLSDSVYGEMDVADEGLIST